MYHRALAASLSGLLAAVFCLAGQATNNNPAASDAPVFLGNHRPPSKKEKTATSRNVSGKVVDVNGAPLEGALVTLTDTKTSTKTTFITKNDGRYKFDDLSFTVDYQLGARYKTFNAEDRKLSQYDHNPNVVRILQVDDSANSNASGSEARKQQN